MEKRNRIVEAARKEFARVPFEEASINQIIKNADISRGSFYTYFTDKMDLLNYVCEDEARQGTESLQELLLICKGDFWEAINGWMDAILEAKDSDIVRESVAVMMNAGFFRRIGVQMGLHDSGAEENPFLKRPDPEKREEVNNWFRNNVDPECIDLDRPSEYVDTAFSMAVTITLMHVIQIFAHPEKIQEIKEEFRRAIYLLKFGACGIRQIR